jgi:anthranilate synthase component 2
MSRAPRILVIDNYDSFTFNLVQYLAELGAKTRVVLNDEVEVDRITRMRIDGLLVSPGPGRPEDAGVSMDAIRALDGRKPILGVCLGHQSIAAVYGGAVERAGNVLHGKTSDVLHAAHGLFDGLSNPFVATRYHSLIVPRAGLPDTLQVTAWTRDDEIMAVRSRTTPTWGVQFHPESILTEAGHDLLQNFLRLCTR